MNIILCSYESTGFFLFCRSEDMTIQSYGNMAEPIPTNYSCLYNAMIHPFTRMVIYGVAWYQGK
jgi:hypothetical protein